ncbi:sensor histidine kinase [Corynebacterium terpenotabidum]|uniref:Two-component system sensor kinase n=1 Tax=Corynebacterium terpenotabidum Y-11 TaxID=1200352 RepID=S4X9N0_9CORY|nr:sensor histidine kinase [Corynebacterium terpenotabidum]AGP29817.1 two-component system sensor kinase [Corynebacterium terpenotabidum Y-11]
MSSTTFPPVPTAGDGTGVFRGSAVIRGSLAVVLVMLLAVTVAAAARRDGGSLTPVIVLAIPFAVVAGTGLARPFPVESPHRYGWLAILTLLWIALASQEAIASYLALILFVLYLLLLPTPWGAVATGLATALAVILSTTVAGPTVGAVLGPVLAGVAAIAIAAGVRSMSVVSEERRQLIDELVRTRGLLAESERQAGIITERERLAHEIHDTVAQGLSSIQLLLHAAERDIPGTSPARSRVELARATAAQSLRETRAIIAALQPDDLQTGTFSEALRRLAESASGDGLEVTVDIEDAGDAGTASAEGATLSTGLPMRLEAGLLRVAQSAVSNVRQHSGAARAKITLTVEPGSVRLDIVDDGRGFDTTEVDRSVTERAKEGHIGLSAMRHRARDLGGTLEIESAPGRGTAVVVSVPRSAQEHQADTADEGENA